MREAPNRTTDDRLLGRLKAGEDSALAELADTYGSRIYQLAFRYLRNREDAEEVAQEALKSAGFECEAASVAGQPS